MRHTSPQLPLVAPWIAHPHAVELAAMSALLDEQPVLSALVQQDLEAGCATNAHTGRPGLTGEQTLRLLLVRQLTGWTYAEQGNKEEASRFLKKYVDVAGANAPAHYVKAARDRLNEIIEGH